MGVREAYTFIAGIDVVVVTPFRDTFRLRGKIEDVSDLAYLSLASGASSPTVSLERNRPTTFWTPEKRVIAGLIHDQRSVGERQLPHRQTNRALHRPD